MFSTGWECQFLYYDINAHYQYKPSKAYLQLISRYFFTHSVANKYSHNGESGYGLFLRGIPEKPQ